VLKLAIHSDRVILPDGKVQSFAARWFELADRAGYEVVRVSVFDPDLFERLRSADGFMWRVGFFAKERALARRLIPAIEHGLGLPMFPSWKTAWHFEDKIAQYYVLQAAGIRMPRTRVLWSRRTALEFVASERLPFVLKLASGFRSGNVVLLQSQRDAERWVGQLFGNGVTSLDRPATGPREAFRRLRDAVKVFAGRTPVKAPIRDELHRGYFYVQEFLEGNAYDTRVTVIGDRAFAFRRLNRPDDFRASGSGRIVWEPSEIDMAFVRLAFRISRLLNTQSIAIDGLYRDGQPVVNEISYTYVSWAVQACPGHWVLHGDPESGELEWTPVQVLPEDAIFSDFVASLEERGARLRSSVG
jgi:hypothetical protein